MRVRMTLSKIFYGFHVLFFACSVVWLIPETKDERAVLLTEAADFLSVSVVAVLSSRAVSPTKTEGLRSSLSLTLF